jgi:hypothetical protein
MQKHDLFIYSDKKYKVVPDSLHIFYAPVSKDREHTVFGLSVSLSGCLSAKTLTLAISFE